MRDELGAISDDQLFAPLELRLALSVSRLWQQDRCEEACQLLTSIYGWFTKGFDTSDLQDTMAPLDQLL